MKKILFVFLMMFSMFAMADNYAKIDYGYELHDADKANQNGFNFLVGTDLSKEIKLDGMMEIRHENGTQGIDSGRFEGGLTYFYENYFIRGAIGQRDATDFSSYSYYSFEPGINFKLANNQSIVTSYRYRDSTGNGEHNAHTDRIKVGYNYGLTKNTALTTAISRSVGDSQYNEFNVGYAFKF